MNIQTLIAKVKEMRQAQKDFFRLTYEAKKDPFKYEERKRVLAESKALEKEVDGMIEKVELVYALDKAIINAEKIGGVKTACLTDKDNITIAQIADDEQPENGMPKFKKPPPPAPPKDRIIREGEEPEKPNRLES